MWACMALVIALLQCGKTVLQRPLIKSLADNTLSWPHGGLHSQSLPLYNALKPFLKGTSAALKALLLRRASCICSACVALVTALRKVVQPLLV